MTEILRMGNQIVWGAPALVLILGVGAYLTVRTRFCQFALLPRALRRFLGQLGRRGETAEGAVSPFRALCTALAATVGTGNIAGVAGAIALGGPGAIFWMWVCALLGMVLKFAEATLAVRYRCRDSAGNLVGGPMYLIRRGMPQRFHWLGAVYAFFGVVAAFGVGNATQINAVVVSCNQALSYFGGQETRLGNLAMGLCLAALVAVLLLGGAERIGAAAERLVPFASAAYLLLGLGVLILRWRAIPEAFGAIFRCAFQPRAFTGGAIGSALLALRTGVSRGVFTNEAGMGTAGIAHAAAGVDHPAEQGLMGLVEVFLDTIVICTMTALVILCSGVTIPYGTDPGAALTVDAFAEIYGGWVAVALSLALCCFAFATVLGWGLYGIRCAQYLFGEKAWRIFAWLQVGVVVLGAVLQTQTVWALAELVNGLMALPNLIAMAYLCPELVRLTQNYKKEIKEEKR